MLDIPMKDFINFSLQNTYLIKLNTIQNLQQVITDYKFEVVEENKVRIYVSKEELSNVMQKLIKNKYQVYSAQEEKLTAEEAFFKKVGENKID